MHVTRSEEAINSYIEDSDRAHHGSCGTTTSTSHAGLDARNKMLAIERAGVTVHVHVQSCPSTNEPSQQLNTRTRA